MKFFYTLLTFFFLFVVNCFSQAGEIPVFHLDTLPEQGVVLDKGWKFHIGDDSRWARPDIDNIGWENINPATDIYYLPQVRNAKVCWLRLQLQLDSSLVGKPLALVINQLGASEIYLNGKLIKRFGQVSSDPKQLQTFNPRAKPVTFQFTGGVQQVFAIRYAMEPNTPYFIDPQTPDNPCFRLRVQQPDKAMENYITPVIAPILAYCFQFGIYLLLTIIHLFFFLYYRARIVNLYFAIYTFSYSVIFMAGMVSFFSHEAPQQLVLQVVYVISDMVNNIFLIISVYKLLNHATDIFLKSVIVCCIVCALFCGLVL